MKKRKYKCTLHIIIAVVVYRVVTVEINEYLSLFYGLTATDGRRLRRSGFSVAGGACETLTRVLVKCRVR